MGSRSWLFVPLVAGTTYCQISDVTPPTLLSFSFNVTTIDTRAIPRNITFAAEAKDDRSGVESTITVVLAGPNRQKQTVVLRRTGVVGTSVVGSPVVYSTNYSFPQFTASGAWRVEHVQLTDLAGNVSTINTTTLQARGYRTSLTVVSTPDITPPQIQSLSFTPLTVNVSAAPVTITASILVSDAQTDLRIDGTFGTYPLLILRSPSGNQTLRVGNTQFNRVSGNIRNGRWEGSFEMPRHAEPGVWRVQQLRIRDAVNNVRDATWTTVTAAVTVSSSPADTTVPTLRSLTIKPAIIDPSLASRTVTVEFVAQDDLSGVDITPEPAWLNEPLGIVFTSPSGGQRTISVLGLFTRTGSPGSAEAWQGTVRFPRFAEAGTWNAEVILQDRARNRRRISADQLRAARLVSNLVVIRPSYVTDGTTGPAGGTIPDKTFGTRAQLTVPSAALPGTTSVSIDVLRAPPNITFPQGFSAQGTRFVNIDLGSQPAPIGSPGYTLTIPLENPLPPDTRLELHRFDPISGSLPRATGVTAAVVSGNVDASGSTATFTRIASFSTVVGLLPFPQTAGDVNGDEVIDCADVSIVRTALGQSAAKKDFDARADVNRNGIVNKSDLLFVLKRVPKEAKCQ